MIDDEDKIDIGVSKISEMGTVTIPKRIRKKQGLEIGSRVTIVSIGKKIYIQKPDPEPVMKALEALGKMRE